MEKGDEAPWFDTCSGQRSCWHSLRSVPSPPYVIALSIKLHNPSKLLSRLLWCVGWGFIQLPTCIWDAQDIGDIHRAVDTTQRLADITQGLWDTHALWGGSWRWGGTRRTSQMTPGACVWGTESSPSSLLMIMGAYVLQFRHPDILICGWLLPCRRYRLQLPQQDLLEPICQISKMSEQMGYQF